MPQNRREQEARQTSRSGRKNVRLARGQLPGAAAADRSALLSDRLWHELISPAVLPAPAPEPEPEPEPELEPAASVPLRNSRENFSYEPTRRERKALKRFYTHAAAGDVSLDHIDEGVAKAFCADKWPARCDKMAMALLCYAERSASWPMGAQRSGTLKVASVGGGPANDACGSFLFASLVPGSCWNRVEATVFDFTPVWGPFCERIAGTALLSEMAAVLTDGPGPEQSELEFALSFALTDLRAPPSAAINQTLLLSHTPIADLFLFSHVVRESAACQHQLLPAILRGCKLGAVFVFLDMQWADLHTVQELVMRVEAEDAAAAVAIAGPNGSEPAVLCPSTRFEAMRVGESQEYPLFGLVFRKLS